MLASPGPALAADRAATELAQGFCQARLAADETATQALLSPTLREAIKVAQDRNQVIAEAAPDEKPPFGDGIPYQRFPDRADSCVPGEPVEKASAVEVPVSYAFKDAPAAGWTDRLMLVRAGMDYLVDDILFDGPPDGGEPTSLTTILLNAFDQ
ncbi:MAG: hypothetical protein KF914_08075 [Rhizobiaceae bacterium]|nr:hypothetical protein [Rhizobiaceae bacterium]